MPCSQLRPGACAPGPGQCACGVLVRPWSQPQGPVRNVVCYVSFYVDRRPAHLVTSAIDLQNACACLQCAGRARTARRTFRERRASARARVIALSFVRHTKRRARAWRLARPRKNVRGAELGGCSCCRGWCGAASRRA